MGQMYLVAFISKINIQNQLTSEYKLLSMFKILQNMPKNGKIVV